MVRTDSGGRLNGALLRAGLVDEVSVLVAPQLAGDAGTVPLHRVAGGDPGGGPLGLQLTHVERLEGDVVWLRYAVVH